MTQKKLLEELMAGEGLPYGWCYCFNKQCQRKEECVRYLSVEYLDATSYSGGAVYPNAWRSGDCKMFCQLQVERRAWGFDNLFREVKVVDAKELRMRLRAYLRSKGQYYRYKLGQLTLSPKKQADILALFRSYGYKNAGFDHYREEITLAF